ncbi:MAG: PD-(D/E)XK nuclease family protein [Acidimicrobiales bacterium]
MPVTVRLEPYGADARAALRDEVARLKGADRLAPVTVLVPRPAVGLATRRWLASGRGGPDGSGVVNVRFLTAARLAAELADAPLRARGSRYATETVQRAAVRRCLAATTGVLAPVRAHPATVRAVTAAYHDLRPVPDDVRRALGRQSPRAAAVVAVVEEVRSRLAGFHDDVDLAREAAAVVRTARPASIGPVVLYLPSSLSAHHGELVDALAQTGPAVAIIGWTGDPAAEGPAAELAARLGSPGAVRRGPPVPPPVVGSVVNAPSADAEVLHVVRSLLARAEQGVPFERMAIVHGGRAPYPRLVRQLLEEAGVPSHGGTGRPLSATAAGRLLLGAFEVAEGGWRRDELVAWFSAVPVLDRGATVPASAWDRLSRRAGVVEGLDQWRSHLTAHAEGQRRTLEEAGAADGDPRPAAAAAGLALTESLERFVAGLAARLGAPPSRWDGWEEWSRRFLADYLGGADRRTGWPADEEQALAEVDEALRRLGELDAVDPGPDQATFRAALASELEAPAPQTARWGRGVLVGEAGQVVGTDLDVLFVVGMSDGTFPGSVADDPVLPDDERRAAGPLVALRGSRRAEARRDYVAALLAAAERSLSFARGDQRGGRVQRPSRWLLDGLQDVAGGERLYSRDLESVAESPGYRVLASYTATVAADGSAVSLADLDRRTLLRWREGHRCIGDHPLAGSDRVLAAGLAAASARRAEAFTRFDGRVGTGAPSPAGAAPQSATGLETYAECPRRYLMRTVLRVDVLDRPEAVVRLSPTDRGQIVHRVLERFVGREVAKAPGERIAPTTSWTAEGGAAGLRSVADEVFAEYEARGLTGRRLLWDFDRQAILRDLVAFIAHDDARRAALGCRPEAVELGFGRHDEPPVTVELGDGRQVPFRGTVDRIDRTSDGTAVVVDYKTGGTYGYEELGDGDPVAGGRRLQLPVYGLAALRHTGCSQAHVGYWFVTERQGFRSIGYPLDRARIETFRDTVSVLVDGIESGCFPARPGPVTRGEPEHCRFCDYAATCPGDRTAAWERVRPASELARYVELVEAGR